MRESEMAVTLEAELEQAQRQVRTDSISMSIGELASMYESSELLINPVFQRLFRWEPHQKSKLIESIMLGIPAVRNKIAHGSSITVREDELSEASDFVIEKMRAFRNEVENCAMSKKYLHAKVSV